jgi:hypothetical protein
MMVFPLWAFEIVVIVVVGSLREAILEEISKIFRKDCNGPSRPGSGIYPAWASMGEGAFCSTVDGDFRA